jgi:hypothetical protein
MQFVEGNVALHVCGQLPASAREMPVAISSTEEQSLGQQNKLKVGQSCDQLEQSILHLYGVDEFFGESIL